MTREQFLKSLTDEQLDFIFSELNEMYYEEDTINVLSNLERFVLECVDETDRRSDENK